MADEPTKDALMERAQELDIEGRSSMSKDALADAIASAEGSSEASSTVTGAPTTGVLNPVDPDESALPDSLAEYYADVRAGDAGTKDDPDRRNLPPKK